MEGSLLTRSSPRPPALRDRFEERTVAALRTPAARWVGLLIGLAALAFFAATLARTGSESWKIIRQVAAPSLAVALGALTLFQISAIASLHALGGTPAPRIWAYAQLVKYLPVPGSAAFGMVGSSVRHGHTASAAVALLVRHSLVLVGTGLAAGSLAIASWASDGTAIALVAGGVPLVSGLVIAFLGSRGLSRDRRVASISSAFLGWSIVGIVLGTTLVGADGGLVVGSSYPAAWVLGLLALPIPAGLGVREAALLVLLRDPLGTEGAVAFAIMTRLLHVASDGATVACVIGWSRVHRRSHERE